MASRIKLYTRFRTPRRHDTTDTYQTSFIVLSNQIMTSETELCTNVRTPHIYETTNTDKTINLVILDADLTNLLIDIYQYQVKVFSKDELNECVDYITSGITDVYLFYIPYNCQYTSSINPYLSTFKNNLYDINIMFTKFQEDFNKQKTGFSFAGKTQQSFNSNKSAAAWWKFFHEILQHIQHTNVAKDEYTALCREYYADKERSLRQIEEFEKTYTSKAVIFWYTRESFFYSLLNKILRIESLNDIFKIRLIITDLVSGLKNARSDDHHQIDYSLQVFRGQQMRMEETQIMQSRIGNSIIINSFLSTTRKKQIALRFAGRPSKDSSMRRVLFTIEIDSDNINNMTTPFADISKYSKHEEEKEVLFSMYSTFRIQSVELGEDNIWDIHLTFIGNLLDTDFGERSIFSPHVDQIFIRHLSKENKQFIAFQLLLDMILRLEPTEYAKREILEFSRSKYQDDPIELSKTDDFEGNYLSEDAAKWYTKDSFLDRLLNESLRIETIDSIVKMRHFIHDLHSQLAQLQPSFIQSLNRLTTLTLYRGQTMKINQLEELKENFRVLFQ